MVKTYPSFSSVVNSFSQKWCEMRGVQFLTTSFANPVTGENSLQFHKQLQYTGTLQTETPTTDFLSYNQSFSNTGKEIIEKDINDSFSLSEKVEWKNDFSWELPDFQNNLYIELETPFGTKQPINPGIQINMFTYGVSFGSEYLFPGNVTAKMFVKENYTNTISAQATKQDYSQHYEVYLRMTGFILIFYKNAQDQEEYVQVNVKDLLSEFQPNDAFSVVGDSLQFRGTGMCIGTLQKDIQLFVTETNMSNPSQSDTYPLPHYSFPGDSLPVMNPDQLSTDEMVSLLMTPSSFSPVTTDPWEGL